MTIQRMNRGARSFTIRAITVVSMACGATLLAACGSKPEPTPLVEDTVAGDMVGAMDKARAVEGTMQEHKEALDRTLQQNENPTAE